MSYTVEIDRAFDNAFIYVLHQHRNDNPSQPNHGLPLPIQPSFLISNLITPFLPIFSPQQAQYYQIKKTSWKNVKKFIKHLDKAKLVKSKDRSGGETVILDVDFNHRSVEEFVPYRLPKKSSSGAAAKSNVDGDTSADPSVGQGWDVKTLYKPSAKLVPHLFPSLSNNDPKNYYSSTDISNRLNDYIASQDPPIVSPSNRRLVNLNPLLANKVFASNSPSDLDVLSRGTVLRDALFKRIIEDPTLCIPHHALLRPGQTLDEVKPKPGALPKVTVTIERRSGNKVATRILGVETFGVVPQILADELQKKCASSTSVAQAVGSPKGIVEILVQGDHRRAVEQALGKRGVKPKWIDVVDKSQKKGGGR
jgi:translation initiation factor 2D